MVLVLLFFFKQKTAYEMRISDWSSDVCSSDLIEQLTLDRGAAHLKDELAVRYAELVYNGFWFAPEREMLQAAIDHSQEKVAGTVRLKLYKGSVNVIGRDRKSTRLNSSH